MRRLIWFFLPLLSYGQCDIEILGFDPISTDLLITVNGGHCGSPSDSIGEFILALGFNPPLDNNPPCFLKTTGWAVVSSELPGLH